MARKHENFTYNYGWKTALESWNFYLNGKHINLDSDTKSTLAHLVLSGRDKEAEDRLKRILRKEEKRIYDFITIGFYGENSSDFYFTRQLKARRSDLEDKLRIYKRWKNYIVEECNGMLKPYEMKSGFITPYGIDSVEDNSSVKIDINRPIIVKFIAEYGAFGA